MTSLGPHLVECGISKKLLTLKVGQPLDGGICELFKLEPGSFLVQEYNNTFEDYVDIVDINVELLPHSKLKVLKKDVEEMVMDDVPLICNRNRGGNCKTDDSKIERPAQSVESKDRSISSSPVQVSSKNDGNGSEDHEQSQRNRKRKAMFYDDISNSEDEDERQTEAGKKKSRKNRGTEQISKNDMVDSSEDHEQCESMDKTSAERVESNLPITITRKAEEKQVKPWPVKFSLPMNNFPRHVKEALANKERLVPRTNTRRAFIAAVFNEMLKYTIAPTSDQYTKVAQAIVMDYPHLADKGPADKSYGTWIACLSDKYRNERQAGRLPKVRVLKTKKADSGKGVGKNIWALENFSPERLEGEDDESQARHVKWMQDNCHLARRDESKVSRLMMLTFPDRRRLVEKTVPIKDIKDVYPCLFSHVQISKEFTRLTEVDADKTFPMNIGSVARQIIQEPMKKHKAYFNNVKEKAKKIQSKEERKNLLIAAALIKLSGYFKDERNDYLIISHKDSVPADCVTPLIIYKGDPLRNDCDFEIYAEGQLICCPIDIMQAFSIVIACYYIFDIAYHKKCKNSLTFLQKHILKLQDKEPTPAAVMSLVNRLN